MDSQGYEKIVQWYQVEVDWRGAGPFLEQERPGV